MALFVLRRTFRCVAILTILASTASGQSFHLPTANRALFEPGGQERYFVGTSGKSWESGTFGGVRSDGRQLHEGLDIRCLQRDKHGEPTDPVMATADGVVAYINRKAALSNYGNYIVLRHHIDGLEVYSLYAHLREARSDLQAGQTVKAGEVIAVMGRTANTHEGISKDRAHVHFEIDLVVNDRYAEWHRRYQQGQRNDHGNWNGQNLRGIDARLLLLDQEREGAQFRLTSFLRNQTELCRVQVRAINFPWVRRYAALIAKNPIAEKEGVAGYELVLNYVGVPYQVIPRAASELKGNARVRLVSVNEAEEQKNPCCKLVTRRHGRWELSNNGENFISLLIF